MTNIVSDELKHALRACLSSIRGLRPLMIPQVCLRQTIAYVQVLECVAQLKAIKAGSTYKVHYSLIWKSSMFETGLW